MKTSIHSSIRGLCPTVVCFIAGLVVTGLPSAGSLAAKTKAGFSDQLEWSVPVDSAESLNAELVDADLVLTNHDDDRVDVILHRTIRGLDESQADAVREHLETRLENEGSRIILEEKSPGSSREWDRLVGFHKFGVSLRYEVRTPASLSLHAKTVDGDLTVEGVGIECNLSTVDGDVILRRADGPIHVQSVDGDLEIGSVAGAVDLSTIDGDVTVESCQDKVRLRTVDGDVTVVMSNSPTEDCEIGSVDGDIRLEVPGDVGMVLDAHSGDGKITVGFPMEVQSVNRHHRTGTIGEGGPRVHLETKDGNISVYPMD